MTLTTNLKTFGLALAIAAGVFAQSQTSQAQGLKTLTVAGGCFWCVEADFEKVSGVKEAVSGFTGGSVENPTYKQVVRGGTGHYEAVKIKYDPSVVSTERLLSLFFRSVDPTDAGGQFCDRGETYRTAVFVQDGAERSAAETAKKNAQSALGSKVVTPILNAGAFYPADEYHQDYYKKSDIILTRFGPKSKAKAYKAYRKACGRDARVKALWGKSAPFAGS